jgi:alkanesulfonate monooxygenase SsuD/methylene tetrahydromethanopterin reductase-like flavin-dependent oxidoreductase (luciferase family)
MTTLGAVFLPTLPPERLLPVARAAEAAGLEQLWLWEDCFRESGVASAAAVLAATARLSVGIGVLPTPLRNVAITAMELATIERMFPGRLVAGIGHGVQSWMGQVGQRVESPLTLLREYATALRALLRGETVTVDGRYVHLDGVALDWPPVVAPPVVSAATGPRTLRLTGEVADGTILTGGTTPDAVRAARVAVDAGRTEAARTGTQGADGSHTVVVYLVAATGSDAVERIARNNERWGVTADLDDVAVHGDAAAVAAGLARWVEAGADVVVLQPTDDEPDPEGFMRFVGREVRPLVP